MKDFIEGEIFESKEVKNGAGHYHRWRRNGKTKLWKTRPEHFIIPVKRGLRQYGYITHDNYTKFKVIK